MRFFQRGTIGTAITEPFPAVSGHVLTVDNKKAIPGQFTPQKGGQCQNRGMKSDANKRKFR